MRRRYARYTATGDSEPQAASPTMTYLSRRHDQGIRRAGMGLLGRRSVAAPAMRGRRATARAIGSGVDVAFAAPAAAHMAANAEDRKSALRADGKNVRGQRCVMATLVAPRPHLVAPGHQVAKGGLARRTPGPSVARHRAAVVANRDIIGTHSANGGPIQCQQARELAFGLAGTPSPSASARSRYRPATNYDWFRRLITGAGRGPAIRWLWKRSIRAVFGRPVVS